MDPLLTTNEVAARLRLAPETLRFWRWKGLGPASFRVGARHFDRKVDAQRWLKNEVTAKLVGGNYVDPTLGRQTFQAYAEAWRASQPHRPTTAKNVEQHLRRYAYDTLGDRPLAAIRPSEVQAWVTALTRVLRQALCTLS